MIIASIAAFFIIMTGIAVIIWQLVLYRAEQIQREQIFQKWIFDSLYSMNNKVVLPDSHEVKEDDNLKASVHSPDEDPMSEFDGVIDDWHGPKRRE